MKDFARCKGEHCSKKHSCEHYTITEDPLEDIVLNRWFINEEYCLTSEHNELDELVKEPYSEFVESKP